MKNLIPALILALLSACTPSLELIAVPTEPVRAASFRVTEQPGASISLSFPKQAFSIQDEGLEEIRSLRLYLVANNKNTQTPLAGPFILNINSFDEDGDSELVSFHNIQPGSYYVAVSAYDLTNGNGNNLTTHIISGKMKVNDGSSENAYGSTGGGESGPNAGRFTVNGDYTVSGNMPLRVTLQVDGD